MDIGPFIAHETVLKCPKCSDMFFRSEQLISLTPYKCTFGFDVLVYVGKALFSHFKGVNEIKQKLLDDNITISDREISFLGKKFIIYLALAHQEATGKLKNYLNRQGGFILHCDATVEGNSPHLFTGLDELSGVILDNVKLPSENAASIIPFFHKLKQRYGTPIALVHDMGKGILVAVKEVFPATPDYICHSHFLSDIGKDLMKDSYKNIFNRLKTIKIRTKLREKRKSFMKLSDPNSNAIDELKRSFENNNLILACHREIGVVSICTLINWALDESYLNGYGFPFDRKHYDLYWRIEHIYNAVDHIIQSFFSEEIKDNKLFYNLRSLLKDVIADESLQKNVEVMTEEIEVFEKLRKALQLAPKHGKKGLNNGDDEVDMRTIEKKVTSFREWITTQDRFLKNEKYRKMIKQIDKYWKKLFREPIWVNTPNGKSTVRPQRTNNIMEQFFRHEKRGYRKRTGTSNLTKTLKAMIANTPLVKNLENKEYLEIILNGCDCLEERFAQIDSKLVTEELKKSQMESESIPPSMKKMIKKSNLPKKIIASITKIVS